MANSRLFHLTSPQTPSNALLLPRTLTLTLALVSFLLSTHCASSRQYSDDSHPERRWSSSVNLQPLEMSPIELKRLAHLLNSRRVSGDSFRPPEPLEAYESHEGSRAASAAAAAAAYSDYHTLPNLHGQVDTESSPDGLSSLDRLEPTYELAQEPLVVSNGRVLVGNDQQADAVLNSLNQLNSPSYDSDQEQQIKVTNSRFIDPKDALFYFSDPPIEQQQQRDSKDATNDIGNNANAPKDEGKPESTKFSTLLEDEATSSTINNSSESLNSLVANSTSKPIDQDKSNDNGQDNVSLKTLTNISVSKQNESEQESFGSLKLSGPAQQASDHWSVSAMFKSIYDGLMKYLPAFMANQKQLAEPDNGKHEAGPLYLLSSQEESAKQSFNAAQPSSKEPARKKTGESQKPDISSETMASGEPPKETDGSRVLPLSLDGNAMHQQAGLSGQQANDWPELSSTASGKRYIADLQGEPDGSHRVSFLKQSTLGLPASLGMPEDRMLANDQQAGFTRNLLGRYLWGNPNSVSGLNYGNDKQQMLDAEPVYGQLAHRPAFLGHLHPGDHLFGSYGSSLRPIYQSAGLKGEANGNTESNDIYFLVMVGAFCVMAMAVVMSAGLFAYRVQQTRKTTNEQDYPTYGVVGPNNMSGKCAASFVGGYFGPGLSGMPNSSGPSSKAASAKFSPEYGDSGLGSNMTGCTLGTGTGGSSKTGSVKSKASGCADHPPGGPSHRAMSGFMVDTQNAARMYHYQHQKQQMIISDRASNGRHTSASDLDSEDENEEGSYTVYECPGLASAHDMEIKNPLFNDDQSP